MEHHCALTCPVVDAVIRQASPAAKMAAAVAAVQNDKISQREAADRFGVSQPSLHRRLVKVSADSSESPDTPLVGVTIDSDESVVTPPAEVTGRDGKVYRKMTPVEIQQAWTLKDQGLPTAEIARLMDRPRATLVSLFKRARPEALQQTQPPAPAPAPVVEPAPTPEPEPEVDEPTPAPPPPVLGALAQELLKQVDKNLLRPEAAVAFKALVAGNALVHRHREQVQKTYRKNGPACMEHYFQVVHQTLLHDHRLAPLLEVMELPAEGTLEQLLDALQFHSRRIYENAGVILGLYRLRTTAPPLPCVIEDEQKQAQAA